MKTLNSIDSMLEKNKAYSEIFKKNPLVTLASDTNVQDVSVRKRLMDAIQILSDYFQKTVMLRYIFCEDSKFIPITTEHLMEEFGHNFGLDKDRNKRPTPWDPVLEACASWFSWKMLTLDNDEKSVLVHLVLETSGLVFFQEAHKTMSHYGETNYFEEHSQADEKHEQMGLNALENSSPEKIERFFLIQKQGWDMMNVICTKIAEIAQQKS
jgi:hypothetical protein